MNPFKYGRVVDAMDFCPRPQLVKQLGEFIQSGQNVVIQGERRIGKTSLIHETVRTLKKYHLIYTDLLEIKTTEDFCKRLLKAFLSMEQRGGFLEKALKSLAHLKPSLSIDPLTGEPSISLDVAAKFRPESIEDILDLVKKTGSHKSLVIAFDEFQDILNLEEHREVLAVLRSKIQFHSKIPYIFAGSIRNRMDEIFNDPDSAFFKSAISLSVGPLQKEPFAEFLKEKFATGKRTIDTAALEKIFAIADEIPGDVQQLCEAFWETSSYKDQINEKNIPNALQLIYSREIKGYEAILVQLTGQQVKCLVGLAKMGGKAPQSAAFLQGVGVFLPASVNKALQRLEQLKIIFRQQREARFVNPFFKSWLLYKGF